MKPPLLVVDVQAGFINDNSRHVIGTIEALARHWLDDGAPVYMSQFTNSPDSQWVRLLNWTRLSSEHEIDITPELKDISRSAVTYRKQSYTCVTGAFLTQLKQETWTEVVVCGIATDGCVLATAVDLFEYEGRSIRPIVVEDACASHAGPDVHAAGLLLIGRFIGRDQLVQSHELL